MMRYNDVYTFVSEGLTGLGYGTDGHPVMPAFDPGPATAQTLWAKTPNALVFLTVGNGIGLLKEGDYDQPFIVVRVLGPQQDFDTAETIALDIDRLLLGVETEMVGATRTLFVSRNAPPQLIDFDASSRYHFQTTYITESRR